jgi:putative DNA primase/helicase
VTGSLVEDVTTARQFVEDYLYNIDTGVGEAFITSEVKQKFNFKVPEIKRLVGFHRETHKRFYNTPQAKEERIGGGVELPDWYEYGESGLRFYPGVLADHCAANADVFYCGEKYYFYENGYYKKEDGELRAFNFIRSHMYADKAKSALQIKDAELQWRMQIDKYAYEVNTNAYLANFCNGIYNALSDELMPHDPKILSTIRLGGNHDPQADCPLFMNYIHRALPETELPLIQEIMGYFLIPINKAQKAFVMLGKAGSGKSTLLHVVQKIMLGLDNCSSLEWQKIDEKFATVLLFGKLANIFADLPNEQIRSTGMFKAIVGEDIISAQHKFKDYFSFKPTSRLLFSCETMPKSYIDRTAGFYRRLIIMKFDNVITEEKRDRQLWDKLAMEVDGIIAWSIIGLKRLIANDFCFSETERTKRELQIYKTDNSTGLSFVDECCVLDQNAEISKRELYNAYCEYCKENNIKHELSTTRFGKDMDELGLKRAITAGVRTWRGIKLL